MRYKPNTPPLNMGCPRTGRTTLMMADLLARCFGWVKPKFRLEPIAIHEINPNKE